MTVTAQPQAHTAVRPGQVGDVPRSARGGPGRHRRRGPRAHPAQGLHGAAQQEASANSQTHEAGYLEWSSTERKTNDLRKLPAGRAHPAIELFQASNVPRARRHGVLAADGAYRHLTNSLRDK